MTPDQESQLDALIGAASRAHEEVTQMQAALNVATFKHNDAKRAVSRWVTQYAADAVVAALAEQSAREDFGILTEASERLVVDGSGVAMLYEVVPHIGIAGTYPVDGCNCKDCNDARFAARVAGSGRAVAAARR